MPEVREHAPPVVLDASTLEIWGLQGSGYSVKLLGEIDDVWNASFIQTQQQLGHGARFYLDRARHVIVFSTRSEEDPQRIIAEMRDLLDLTNRRAGRQVPQIVVPAMAPRADEETRRLTRPKTAVSPEPARKPIGLAARMENSRDSSRVGASLMVEFCGAGSLGPESASTGMTRDLSESGVFVQTNRLPSVGERLYLTIHLTPQKQIDLTGEVVRVLEREEARRMQLRPGFGARVTDPSGKYSFHLLVRNQAAL